MTKKQKVICKCKNVKESGIPCGNPLYAIIDGVFVIKRHGREVSIKLEQGQTAKIKCERCGGVTKVGG